MDESPELKEKQVSSSADVASIGDLIKKQ